MCVSPIWLCRINCDEIFGAPECYIFYVLSRTRFKGAVVHRPAKRPSTTRRIERFTNRELCHMEPTLTHPTYLIGNRFTKKTFPGQPQEYHHCRANTNMLLKIENQLLQSHRQRETTGIKKLYNSFFVLF
nr:uncharacterized protein LOC110384613 [Helicoverpa armigera]